MVDNLLVNLKTDRIIRIDVSYGGNSKTLDDYIGRKAHISFLENLYVMKMMVYTFSEILC